MSGGAAVKAASGDEGDRPACTSLSPRRRGRRAEGRGNAPAALVLALTARGRRPLQKKKKLRGLRPRQPAAPLPPARGIVTGCPKLRFLPGAGSAQVRALPPQLREGGKARARFRHRPDAPEADLHSCALAVLLLPREESWMETGQFRAKPRRTLSALRARRRWMRSRLGRQSRKVSTALTRGRALSWRRLYALRYRVLLWRSRHGTIAAIIALAAVFALSTLSIPMLQGRLGPYFAAEARLDALRALFLTLGGALVGAAAIVTSLVLFAMQVNVERMPHGLFRRLSGDRRLLGAFALTFVLAVAVAAVSLVPDANHIGVANFAAGWGTILILILFLYGYQRALLLISPVRQLGLVVADARKELRAWPRRALPLLLPRQKMRRHPKLIFSGWRSSSSIPAGRMGPAGPSFMPSRSPAVMPSRAITRYRPRH